MGPGSAGRICPAPPAERHQKPSSPIWVDSDRPAPGAPGTAREGGSGFIQLTMADLIIRSATHQDIAAVLSLWQGCGTPPGVSDTHEGLAGLLAVAPEGLLVAESQEIMIGSLIVGWDGWRGSFYRLAVRPEQRRQGVATALVREGERRLGR